MTMNNDLQHLKILAIVHWIWGGMIALFSCFGLIYVVLGIAVVNDVFPASGTSNANQMPSEFGWLFVGIGSCVTVFGWLIGALNIYCGFLLKQHRRRVFCIVIAAIDCISFPIGTTLGVFTMIVLVRDSVKRLYETHEPPHGIA